MASQTVTARASSTTSGAFGVVTAYQPIVDIDSGAPVAWEALSRGPAGEPPMSLFAAAEEQGRLVELDEECRETAVRGAVTVGLAAPLFLNVEPVALRRGGTLHLAQLANRAPTLSLVLEVTERALAARPADLIHFLAAARQEGWAIALDDVGADPRSLALMPLVRPDVVKLDLDLVQNPATRHTAAVISAVAAECERTGAVLLAEGIETERQRRRATAMGARYGQGWLFGRPGELPAGASGPALKLLAAPEPAARTPFEAVRPHRQVRTAGWRFLLEVSHLLEERATTLGDDVVVVSAFQDAERFTPKTRVRYSRLAASTAFVAALGVGLSAEPVTGVRGATLSTRDPLRGEWSVVVLAPHFAAALVARETTRDIDGERSFDYAITHERDLVIAAARSLMNRVHPR